MSKSLSDTKWLILHKNPQTGYTEQIVYTGNIKNKPTGWHIQKKLTS